MRRRYSITIALLVSLFVYVFYRSDKTVVNELITLLLSPASYSYMKQIVLTTVPLPKLIIYSLPGGLWIFCVTSLAQDFYITVKAYVINLYLIPILFAIGLEICQLMHLTNGSFDVWDIVSYGLFWMLAMNTRRADATQQNLLAPFTVRGFTCLACFLSVYLAHVNH
ncbi:hypothetical protein [Pseudochryseolinea flava]|uniref:Uncharacterized protein n=1 Tax=Pseudochryseolinea flava TaxID=2059302 RepID=A0A364Y710_9BACT|nr:hypothetical protein [Pseudochryseolinea flava]RAW02187.1 hypothetical protein DQQ10_06500 [Pseudochryseolinea flava]